MELSRTHLGAAIQGGLSTVMLGALITSLALVIIAAIDVPYQRFEFIKKLRMTKQEVKEERKETNRRLDDLPWRTCAERS